MGEGAGLTNSIMKGPALFTLCTAILLAAPPARAVDTNEWSFDVSIYGLAVGMNGDLGIGPVTADVDVGLDDILNNLEFGFMGTTSVGYGPWALTLEGLYMGLQGTKDDVTVELDQIMVEPTLSYRVSQYFEPLAGFRYNNLNGEIRGPEVLPVPRIPTGTQDWFDPIVGANLALPLGKGFSLKLRGDVGGFGVGSDLTWQVYPYLNWQFSKWGSVQAGYRWLYMDYETGGGSDRFAYDILNQGAQIGFTFHF
jgi:hypothetical protein